MDKFFGENTRLIGIVRETAPTAKNAQTDEDFGLGAFQSEYFNSNPIFKDEEMVFFNALGRKPINISFNPFSLIGQIWSMWHRVKSKGISGNLSAGDGTILGGVIVIKEGNIVYFSSEHLDDSFNADEIAAAAKGEPAPVGNLSGTFLRPEQITKSSS